MPDEKLYRIVADVPEPPRWERALDAERKVRAWGKVQQTCDGNPALMIRYIVGEIEDHADWCSKILTKEELDQLRELAAALTPATLAALEEAADD